MVYRLRSIRRGRIRSLYCIIIHSLGKPKAHLLDENYSSLLTRSLNFYLSRITTTYGWNFIIPYMISDFNDNDFIREQRTRCIYLCNVYQNR